MNSQPKKHILKTAATALGFSTLLALSACSNNETAEETTVVSEAELVTVEEQAPMADTEMVDEATAPVDEPVSSMDTTEMSEPENTEVAAAEPELLAADAGAKLYEQQCKICHANGLLNAPKYGDKASWSAALGKDKQTLYMHSAQGFNKMPAQAVNGVTEAQVKAAVDYMLESVS